MHQRILVAFPCERNPHVNRLRLHGVPDKLQLLPQELYLEGRSSKFHALLAGMNELIVLPLTTSHHIRPVKDDRVYRMSLAELRMNTSSETTWMPAANNGLSRPSKARPSPIPSTMSVP